MHSRDGSRNCGSYPDVARIARGLVAFYDSLKAVEETVKASESLDSISDEELDKVPLHFVIPVGMTSRYAHHMIVQASDFEVTISFFELKAPPALGGVEIQREVLKQGVTAECVARVTIAKARYADFIKAFVNIPLESTKETQ